MRSQPVKEIARGHWRFILPRLGIDPKLLDGKHHPCPACGGRDRFRFTDRDNDGMFWCNGCGTGDGFVLLARATQMSFDEIAKRIREMIGAAPAPVVAAPDTAESRRAMRDLWTASKPVEERSIIGRYLLARTGSSVESEALRENGNMLIARVSDAKDRGVNLHRTIAPKDGWKPGVEVKRLLMRGSFPDGATVKLWPAEEVMGIAEGIETAISAARMWDIPVWAALNAQNLAKWTPPEGTKGVFIFGDNDRSFTGQAAAYTLANRLSKIEGLGITVEIPDEPGTDWNDIFRRRLLNAC